ncbi:aspartate aminotransferase family protein [Actinokineospora guangxiensis]|uniref:Aspartate aminotransferase family protein n=1 Tax=Actinokineospora guangxiensis TaxID=1490288 RepID=A0ABW0EGW7_9PSEU
MTGPGRPQRLLAARQRLAPIAFDRAEGSWVHAPDGRRYLDASSGLVCVNIGHAHPAVVSALTRQAQVGSFASPGTFRADPQERLAAETARAAHRPDDAVVFTSTGTAGVEMAIALARLVHRARGDSGRHRVLTSSLGYHGNSALTLALSGHRRRRPHPDDAFGLAPAFDPPYPELHRRCRLAACDAGCADEVAEAIDAAGVEQVAAVLVEPVNGTTGGGFRPPPGYLARLERLCARRGVLVIHDEVLTGLGRTGLPLGAHHDAGSDADIVVLSKGLGAGYVPLSAVLLAPGHAEAIARGGLPLPLMGTMSATPLQAAVGSAVLGVLGGLGALDPDVPRGLDVEAAVRAATTGLAAVTDVRGCGYFFGIEVTDGTQSDLIAAARDNDLLLYPFNGFRDDGSGEGVIVAPPLTITPAETDFLAAALRTSLEKWS